MSKAVDTLKTLSEATRKARLAKGGMGGFLNPPGHPEHDYSVIEGDGRDASHMSLTHALKYDIDPEVKKAVKELMDKWESDKPSLDDPKVQDWVHQVMGYFKNSYKGDSFDVKDLRFSKDADPVASQDLHAGVNFIRKYYPDFKLSKGHVDNAYWGQKKTESKSKAMKVLDYIFEDAKKDGPVLKDFNNCLIIGKRWFNKSGGNTYHSVRVIVDGDEIGSADFVYGYGDQYIDTAHKILMDKGYFSKTGERKGGMSKDYYDFLNYMRDNRKKFTTTVSDVTRKKDL